MSVSILSYLIRKLDFVICKNVLGTLALLRTVFPTVLTLRMPVLPIVSKTPPVLPTVSRNLSHASTFVRVLMVVHLAVKESGIKIFAFIYLKVKEVNFTWLKQVWKSLI